MTGSPDTAKAATPRRARRITIGNGARRGRLLARQASGARPPAASGVRAVGPTGERDCLLYVPSGYAPERPAPLIVSLHGAGGTARHALDRLSPLTGAAGLLILAPTSQRATWDLLTGGYGPDVAALDEALAWVFARYAVDPARIAAEGFSDGASYALSLGLTNGDLFTHVIAFSPGFVAPAEPHGAPQIFIAHGTGDEVLPIDPCSRQIVPRLRRAGYALCYHEFDGPHTVPPSIAREAVAWFIDGER